jgi:diguanylate cyclase (GGDEF)-like protein/PAS domain S-box-containing protein
MNIFDMRTMLLACVFSNIISGSVFVSFWISVRKRYHGMGLIAVSFSLYTMGWLLAALRDGIVPDFVSMTVSNTMAVAGAFLGFWGLESFVEKPSNQIINILIVGIFPLIHGFFLFVQPDMIIRAIVLFSILGIYFVQCMVLLLFRVERYSRYFTRMTGIVFAVLALVCVLRVFQLLIFPSHSADFLKSGDLDALFMIALLMLVLLLTFSIMMMVNKRLSETIREQEEKYAKAFFHAPYGIILKRQSDEKILEVNDGFTRITGFKNEEVVGKKISEILLWDDEKDHLQALEEIDKKGKIKEIETLFRSREGEAFIGLYSAETIVINGEEVILSVINDVTERKQAEEQIKHMANHDALTDLPSLRLIQDKFWMAESLVKRNNAKIAVMFIDLDCFKTINDTFGHKFGDYVLRQVAQRLEQVLGENDTVGRIGGDEFLLIAPFQDAEVSEKMAQKVIHSITKPIDLNGQRIEISASIGIALYPDDAETFDQLIKLADDAMYQIKKSGKNGFTYSSIENNRQRDGVNQLGTTREIR